MSINKIGNNQGANHPASVNRAHDSRGKESFTKKANSEQVATVIKIKDASKENIKNINQLITEEMINDYISQIKAQSNIVVKFYPPYPAGAEDRISILNNFAAFRELIKRLTLPQPETEKEIEAEMKSIELKQKLMSEKVIGLTIEQTKLKANLNK